MNKALIKSIGVYQILAVKYTIQAYIISSKYVKLFQININGSVTGFNKYLYLNWWNKTACGSGSDTQYSQEVAYLKTTHLIWNSRTVFIKIHHWGSDIHTRNLS